MKDINLLPEDIKGTQAELAVPKSSGTRISVLAIIITIFVVILMIGSMAVPKFILMSFDKEIEALNKKIVSKEYQEVKVVNAKIMTVTTAINTKNEILKAIDSRSYPVSDILNTLQRSSPKGLYITDFSFDGSKMIINGNAASSLQVAELIANIDRLENVSRAGQTENLTFEKTNSRYDFTLMFSIVRKEG